MKTLSILAVFLVLAIGSTGVLLAFCPYSVECPLHDGFTGYKEGNDVWVDTKWVATYKCIYNGHKFQMVCEQP